MSTQNTVPVYQALAEDIKRLGVPVFGLMSDDTVLFVATLDAIGVAYHGSRHETNALSMADGYASGSGKLGIACVGRGPATANAICGITNATRTGNKVLVICGEAPNIPSSLGPDTKGFNTVGVLSAAGVPVFVANTPRNAQRVLAEAIAAAEGGKAVALLLPTNVQRSLIEPASALELPPKAPSPAAKPRSESIAAAAALLQKSRKPLFIAGVGAHRAGARPAIERLADKVGAVIATTLKAKDMFRGHPCNIDIIGTFSHSAARRMIDQTDCVVVFGASMNQRTTSFGQALPAGAPVIQVDAVRGNIGRWSPADVAVAADARLAAEALIDVLADRPQAEKPFHSEENRRSLAEFDIAKDFQPEHTPRTVDPRSLTLELDRLLPKERNVVSDSGNFLLFWPYLSVPGPDRLKITGDFSSVGMGIGSAMGFAKARPEVPTVFVAGDGGLFMTFGELETVVREDIPLVIVVMNDCAYGAEVHHLVLDKMPVAKAVFPDVDLAPIAQALGYRAATIRSLDDLRKAAPMLQKPEGPILLDCKVNGAVACPVIAEMVALEHRRQAAAKK